MVLHLRGLLWLLSRELTAKGKKGSREPIRKVFQKSRLVIMVALPRLVEVEVVINTRMPGTFGR